jgi:hypothetical protein
MVITLCRPGIIYTWSRLAGHVSERRISGSYCYRTRVGAVGTMGQQSLEINAVPRFATTSTVSSGAARPKVVLGVNVRACSKHKGATDMFILWARGSAGAGAG